MDAYEERTAIAKAYHDAGWEAAFEQVALTYGAVVATWLRGKVAEIQAEADSYPYQDSFRFADESSEADREVFYMSRSCCGSLEVEWTYAPGITFLYGFNYGH